MNKHTGDQFPPEYRRRIFIAEHGSWNRSPKSGYRITMVTLRDSEPTKYESFAEGWLSGNSVWAGQLMCWSALMGRYWYPTIRTACFTTSPTAVGKRAVA